MSNLEHREQWTGQHKGIRFKIGRYMQKDYLYKGPDVPVWTYYIYIREQSLPADIRDDIILTGEMKSLFGGIKTLCYDYMGSGLLRNLDWQGGITFYGQHGGIYGQPITVEAGCDFNHSWDQGHQNSYTLEYIQGCCQRTIDDFIECVPNLKYWCNGNGNWYNADEGRFTDEGAFYSHAHAKDFEARKVEA